MASAATVQTSWRSKFAIRVQIFFLWLLPVILLMSHRNTVAMLVLMAAAAAFYPGIWQNPLKGWRLKTMTEPGSRASFLWLLTFCLYALVTVIWTPVPERADWALKLVLFLLAGAAVIRLVLIVPQAEQRQLLLAYVYGMAVSGAVLGIEGITGGGLRDILPPEGRPDKDLIASARGAGIAIYLAAPAALVLITRSMLSDVLPRRRRVSMAVLTVIGVLLAAVLLDISANLLAALAALTGGAAGFLFGKTVLRVAVWGMLAILVLAPFMALLLPPVSELVTITDWPASWVQRLIAWRVSVENIFSSASSFVFGGGLGFSRALYNEGVTVILPSMPAPLPVMPTHPHNLFLQIWLEFGLVGVSLVSAAMMQAGRYIITAKINHVLVGGICALSFTFLVFATVEINLWTLWRLAAVVFAIMGLALCQRRNS